MKATSLSICIPVEGKCNKNCPYCVSKMTGCSPVTGWNSFRRRLEKARTIAELSGVTSIILTGKSEPLLNLSALEVAAEEFHDFPLIVQTNGRLLVKDLSTIDRLAEIDIDIIAVSVDTVREIVDLKAAAKEIHECGMTLRITVNLSDRIMDVMTPEQVFAACKTQGIDQLSFRVLTIPDYPVDTAASRKAQEWIQKNVDTEKLSRFFRDYEDLVERHGRFVSRLPFGAKLYDVDGVSCTLFHHCIQESNGEDDIRTLVYWEDGHLSTSWYGSNVGRIF